MFRLQDRFVRTSIIFGMLISMAHNAFATIDHLYYTRDSIQNKAADDLIKSLVSNNEHFRNIYTLLDQSFNQAYTMVWIDPKNEKMFSIKSRHGVMHTGFFMPAQDTLVIPKAKPAYEPYIKPLRGQNIIVIYLYVYKDKQGHKQVLLPKATVLQETFHALQYEYFSNQDRVLEFLQLDKYPSREVESEIIHFVLDKGHHWDHQYREDFHLIDGFNEVIAYFNALINQEDKPLQEQISHSQTLESVWYYLTKYLGYKNKFHGKKIKHPTIRLQDFETLYWYLNSHASLVD